MATAAQDISRMPPTHLPLVAVPTLPGDLARDMWMTLLCLTVGCLLVCSLVALALVRHSPLRRRVRRALHAARSREQYEFAPTLQRFSQELATLRDQEGVVNLLLDGLVATLDLSGIAFVALPDGLDERLLRLIEADDLRARRAYATPDGRVEVLRGLASLDLATRRLSREEPLLLRPWQGCAALTLVGPPTGGEGLALLVIGKKRSGHPLHRDDRSLLVTLAHQAATALENALLVAGYKTSLAQVQVSTEQLVAARAEQQLLLRELVNADERQRAALARDLHDDALQEALYLIRHSRLCGDLAEHVGDQLAAGISDTSDTSDTSSDAGPHIPLSMTIARLQQELKHLSERSIVVERKLRELCLGLYPALLPSLGLPSALEDLTKELTSSLGVHIEVHVDDAALSAASNVQSEVALHLYRIAQEALRNAGKHAHAARADVSLQVVHVAAEHKPGRPATERAFLELRITDTGRGLALPIDYVALLRQGHLGLAGMRERAERIGGNLTIAAVAGGGTSVTVRTPLEENGNAAVGAYSAARTPSHETPLNMTSNTQASITASIKE